MNSVLERNEVAADSRWQTWVKNRSVKTCQCFGKGEVSSSVRLRMALGQTLNTGNADK